MYRSESVSKVLLRSGAVLAASFALGACGADKPKLPSYGKNDSPAPFLADLYNHKKVTSCSGVSILRKDGHVRSEPYSVEQQTSNEISIYGDAAAQKKVVKVIDPHLIKLASDVDDKWYIDKLPDGHAAFINHDALVKDNFKCENVTSPYSAPGTLTVTDGTFAYPAQ